jgi:hypothetical protein
MKEVGLPWGSQESRSHGKAADDSGGFVATDHPVGLHRPGGLNYGQQFAPGLGLSDRDVLFPLSSKVALIGRMEGEEDVI